VAFRHATAANPQTGEPVFQVGALRVDLARRQVTVNNKPVHLTPNEFRLLSVLIKNAGRVLTHRQLLRQVWGPESNEETHYLRVYMNQLRQKLELDPARPQYLLTESGVGYRLLSDG
jgi:two-component system KDP operon response regulator KdpE